MTSYPGLPKRAVVARTLPCQACGYNLRGVRIEADCPECGRPVVETLERALDPDAPRLAELHNPRLVGNALVALVIFQSAILLIIATGPVLSAIAAMIGVVSDPSASGSIPAGWALITAACVSFLALAAALVFAVAGGDAADRRVRRSVVMVSTGHALFGLLLLAGWWLKGLWIHEHRGIVLGEARVEQAIVVLALIACAIVALMGNAGLLAAIGERSRVYREATIARQGINGLVITCVLAAVGTAATALLAYRTEAWAEWLDVAARFIVIASVVMLIIGMIYLVANALWIRNGIRTAAGRLGDLVRIEPDSVFLASGGRGSKTPTDGGKADSE